ncbi:glutathione S-transferase family protein [Thalassobaculum sp.]|uniref:glutathione S-transferase family protein n=1 Tax=Thalassobaculum sp. TaxID=2022740 RepID=UPI0032EC25AD
MHTLYWKPQSGSLAPMTLLEETGLPYEAVKVNADAGEHKSEAYKRDVHPLGLIPALRLPDGTVMIESAAMVIYLADLAPQKGLAPAPTDAKRATYLQWLVYGAATLYPAYIRLYHPDYHRVREGDDEAVKALARTAIDTAWAAVERGLADGRPFLLGDTASAADLYTGMLALWHPDPAAFKEACPNVAALRKAVWGRPAAAKALAAHAK